MRASKAGSLTGTATVTASSLRAALTPTVGAVIRLAGKIQFTITNYDASYGWKIVSSVGTVTRATPSGKNMLVTVSSLSPNQAATVTITTTKVGSVTGTKTVMGQALAR